MGLNTYPSNPFPPSTDRMDADALETEVSKLNNDVGELKSGLTNYENQNNLNLEVPNRKNLIDSSAYSSGYFTSEGVLTENQYYYATDYIKVEPNTDYVVSGFTGGGAYFVYYNASKTVLSTVVDTTTTFKTPANTAFVRLSIKRDGMTNPQMELGTTASAYTAYIPSVETRLENLNHIFVGGCIAGLALNDGNIAFSVPVVGKYTSIVSASQTCTGTIYGSIDAVGSVSFAMASNSLTGGVLRFRLTPSVTLSDYTAPAKVFMCEIDKIEFTLS